MEANPRKEKSTRERLEDRVDRISRRLREIIDAMTNTVRAIEKASLMQSTGEIDETTFQSLIEEYDRELTRRFLELLSVRQKAKKVEAELKAVIAKLKLSPSGSRIISPNGRILSGEDEIRLYTSKLRELERAMNSGDVADEICAFERALQYVDLSNAETSAMREYLEDLSGRWAVTRSEMAERISSLEMRINEVEESIKENDVRFVLGEYDRIEYEERRLKLERELNRLKEEIDRLKTSISMNDTRIIRAAEKLGESR